MERECFAAVCQSQTNFIATNKEPNLSYEQTIAHFPGFA